ncbi:MAG: UbiD family decarboxylase, partial [Deltaproteobacteria bacterium]|nr:UbiD family decarboxylase [Deltaproteobacteria bacterium]
MPKSLRTFLEDCRREIPAEVVHVEREVDPARYDVSAIIKHLGAERKFPMLIFERPRNLHGRVGDFKLVMNFTISQRKTQIALGLPKEMTRARMAEACVDIERNRVAPVVVENREAPVMENVRSGDAVDLHELPIMRHHYMDGGPYITLCTIAKDRRQGIYNASYHRMEIKSRNHTTHY